MRRMNQEELEGETSSEIGLQEVKRAGEIQEEVRRFDCQTYLGLIAKRIRINQFKKVSGGGSPHWAYARSVI